MFDYKMALFTGIAFFIGFMVGAFFIDWVFRRLTPKCDDLPVRPLMKLDDTESCTGEMKQNVSYKLSADEMLKAAGSSPMPKVKPPKDDGCEWKSKNGHLHKAVYIENARRYCYCLLAENIYGDGRWRASIAAPPTASDPTFQGLLILGITRKGVDDNEAKFFAERCLDGFLNSGDIEELNREDKKFLTLMF